VTTSLTLGTRIQRIRKRRAVLQRMIRTDLSVKYEGSTLGYFWSVLEPLLMTGVYWLVFGLIGRLGRVQPFPPYILSGILAWQWMSASFTGSMRTLRGNSKLISKIGDLPREIYPMQLVLTKGIEFLITISVLVPVAFAFGLRPSLYMFYLPLAIVLQLMLLTGLSLGLSAANTLLRDLERVSRPVLRAWFYLSPVLYPLILVDERASSLAQTLYRLNPMTGILTLHRSAWSGWTMRPRGGGAVATVSQFDSWLTVGYSAIGCALILVIGYLLFTRLEPRVLKEI